jgi:hypothetical protein
MNEDPSINKDLFFYLVRHNKVFFPNSEWINSNRPHVLVEDRFFQIENNKKYLKRKIYNLIEQDKPELVDGKENISKTNKTIKYFLQESNKIKKL